MINEIKSSAIVICKLIFFSRRKISKTSISLCMCACVCVCGMYMHLFWFYFIFTLFYLDSIYLPLLSCMLYQALLQYFYDLYVTLWVTSEFIIFGIWFDRKSIATLVCTAAATDTAATAAIIATDAVISNQILELFWVFHKYHFFLLLLFSSTPSVLSLFRFFIFDVHLLFPSHFEEMRFYEKNIETLLYYFRILYGINKHSL